MWETIVDWFEGRNLEFLVADILLIAAIVYYIPKGLYWWFTTKESDIKEDDKRFNAKKPEDYL